MLVCVSNEVGGNLVGNSVWGGVRLADVLQVVGIRPGRRRCRLQRGRRIHGLDTSRAATAPTTLSAVSQNGTPLQQQTDFPAVCAFHRSTE